MNVTYKKVLLGEGRAQAIFTFLTSSAKFKLKGGVLKYFDFY